MVCHSLLQWTTFCQTSPPWHVHLGWPHRAWLSFIELDKTAVCVIRFWLDWLVFCDYGFSVSALWRPLTTPTILLGFLLPRTWGIASWLLQQSTEVQWLWWTMQKCGREEVPLARGQGRRPRGATSRPRSGGCTGTGGLRGATPCSRSGGAAVKRYPSSKVKSCSENPNYTCWPDRTSSIITSVVEPQ